MIRKEEVVKIGFVAKTHGISGELSINFLNDLFENSDPDLIVFELEGIMVPFFIDQYRFRSDTAALIKLEDIDTEEKAKRLVKADIYLPLDLVENNAKDMDHYSWSNFLGYTLVDTELGAIGEITDVDDSTLNILLKVIYQGEETLIPIDENLVEWINVEKREIGMQIPSGLLSL